MQSGITNIIHYHYAEVYPRQKIRNQWLVAYTLIRNPSLQNLTASNLKSKEVLDESSTHENESIDKKSTEDDAASPLVENAAL